jgi:hypothetical protein
MAVFYLDVDDEITSAATRIRSSADVDVALVLPAGSRIATSRINFRLLAREAGEHSRRLSIIAPEASSRALAASAGLPVFGSVVEYEDARGGEAAAAAAAAAAAGVAAGAAAALAPVPSLDATPGDETPGAPSSRIVGAAIVTGAAIGAAGVAATRSGAHARPLPQVGAPPDAPTQTVPASASGVPGEPPPAAAGDLARPSARDGARPRGAVGASTGLAAAPVPAARRRRRWPLVVAVLLVVALLAGAGAAVGYVLLPTATVTLQITTQPVGPVVFVGTADPDAVAVDVETATIPAWRVPVPLSATGTFKATGKRVVSSFATGQVRWRNCDATRAFTIPKGTQVRTATGIAFQTREAVFLPVAILNPPQITCQYRTVDVRAVRDGPAGNVGPGTITSIPGEYNSVVISVTNPKATAGGSREEFPQVTQKDVASATARLTKQLDAQLASVAADPPGTPAGATAYPETARRGDVTPSEPPADLVGQEVETFDLTLTAEGTVVAADPAPLEAIGAARVAAEVPEGMQLREGSMQVEVGPGVAKGELIRYPVEAQAEALRTISEAAVREMILGKTPAQAEEILSNYGTVEVVLWPDWATTITTIDSRVTVSVEGVPPAEASPAPSAAPGSTPGPSGVPPPSGVPSSSSASPGASPTASAVPSATAAP